MSDDRITRKKIERCGNILRQYWNDDLLELQEEFKIMLINRYNKVIGIFSVSQEGIAGTVDDPKLIFGCALNAA